MLLGAAQVRPGPRGRREDHCQLTRELERAEGLQGEVCDARGPECLDACLLAAVVVDEAEETTTDAEEDEPVARWQFGADGGEAWSGRLVGAEGGGKGTDPGI